MRAAQAPAARVGRPAAARHRGPARRRRRSLVLPSTPGSPSSPAASSGSTSSSSSPASSSPACSLRELDATARRRSSASTRAACGGSCPPRALVLVVDAVASLARAAAARRRDGRGDAAAARSTSQLALRARSGDYLAAAATRRPFLHFWSLAVEEQFYLALAGSCCCRAARARRRRCPRRAARASSVGSFAVSRVWLDAGEPTVGVLLAADPGVGARASGRCSPLARRRSRRCRPALAPSAGGPRPGDRRRRRRGLRRGRRSPGWRRSCRRSARRWSIVARSATRGQRRRPACRPAPDAVRGPASRTRSTSGTGRCSCFATAIVAGGGSPAGRSRGGGLRVPAGGAVLRLVEDPFRRSKLLAAHPRRALVVVPSAPPRRGRRLPLRRSSPSGPGRRPDRARRRVLRPRRRPATPAAPPAERGDRADLGDRLVAPITLRRPRTTCPYSTATLPTARSPTPPTHRLRVRRHDEPYDVVLLGDSHAATWFPPLSSSPSSSTGGWCR